MRMMVTVSIPVEAGNAAIKNGSLMTLIQKFLADRKPEAAYFFADASGQRSGFMVLDMKDPSEIPGIAEPWFQGLNAEVKVFPCMNPQDLATAGPGIESAVKGTGKI
jgi:Domain of unknown function (DUF3303)